MELKDCTSQIDDLAEAIGAKNFCKKNGIQFKF